MGVRGGDALVVGGRVEECGGKACPPHTHPIPPNRTPADCVRHRVRRRRPLPADLVLLVDVDFAVSLSLAQQVRAQGTYNELMALLNDRCGGCCRQTRFLLNNP